MCRRRRTERGAAALEFALVLPILLFLLFGFIAFGMIFAQNLALGNGARQAARFGAVEGHTCDDIVEEARDNSNSVGMAGSAVTVAITRGSFSCSGGSGIPCQGSATGESVRVVIGYTSPVIVPVPGVPSSVNITGEGEFRCEFQ